MRNVDEQQNTGLTEPGTYPFTLIIGQKITMRQENHKVRGSKPLDSGSNRQALTALGQMEMNPDDVTALGLRDGAKVRVSNEMGGVVLSIRNSTRLARGNLFVQVTEPNVVLVSLLTNEQKQASSSDSPLSQRPFIYTSVRIDAIHEMV